MYKGSLGKYDSEKKEYRIPGDRRGPIYKRRDLLYSSASILGNIVTKVIPIISSIFII